MMSPQKLIRKEGRGRLKGHWSTALGIFCVPLAALIVVAFAAEYIYSCAGFYDNPKSSALTVAAEIIIQAAVLAAVALVLFFLIRPMMLGIRRWFCALAFGNDTGAGTVLYYFRKDEYGPCIRYSFRLLLYVLRTALPIAVAWIAVSAVSVWIADASVFSTLFRQGVNALSVSQQMVLLNCLTFTGVVGLIALPICCQHLFLSDYLFITERDWYCIRHSVEMMRHNKRASLLLLLSFCPWALLCILIFPLLFAAPFFCSSLAVCRKWMVYNFRNPIPAPPSDAARIP